MSLRSTRCCTRIAAPSCERDRCGSPCGGRRTTQPTRPTRSCGRPEADRSRNGSMPWPGFSCRRRTASSPTDPEQSRSVRPAASPYVHPAPPERGSRMARRPRAIGVARCQCRATRSRRIRRRDISRRRISSRSTRASIRPTSARTGTRRGARFGSTRCCAPIPRSRPTRCSGIKPTRAVRAPTSSRRRSSRQWPLYVRQGTAIRSSTRAVRLLGQWDRRYTKDNERAVLFEAMMTALQDLTWDELARPPHLVMRQGARRRVRGRTAPLRVDTPADQLLAILLRDPVKPVVGSSCNGASRGTARRHSRRGHARGLSPHSRAVRRSRVRRMAMGPRASRQHLPPAAARVALASRRSRAGWSLHAESLLRRRTVWRELANGRRARPGGSRLDDLSGRTVRQCGIHSLCRPDRSVVRRHARPGAVSAKRGGHSRQPRCRTADAHAEAASAIHRCASFCSRSRLASARGSWAGGAFPVFAAVAGVLARDIPRQAIAAGVAAAVAWGALARVECDHRVRLVILARCGRRRGCVRTALDPADTSLSRRACLECGGGRAVCDPMETRCKLMFVARLRRAP